MAELQDSALADYLKTLFDNWAKTRQTLLESKWRDNENAFLGIATVTWKKGEAEDWRSSSLINLTRQKVLAAYAIVIDMLLQGGEIPFMLKPSPWTEIAMRHMPAEYHEAVEDEIDKMQQQIRQQLADCHADRALMRNILSNAVYGETVAKTEVRPVTRKGFIPLQTNGETPDATRFVRYEFERAQLSWRDVNLWDIFRDLEATDLVKGRGTFERTFVTPYELRKDMADGGYLDDQIKRVIRDGAAYVQNQQTKQPDHPASSHRKIVSPERIIERREFWGRVPRELAERLEHELAGGQATQETYQEREENRGDEIEVKVVLANDLIILYSRNADGDRPYYRSIWEMGLNDAVEPHGIADAVKNTQDDLTGCWRAMQDNIKLAANVILAIKRRFLLNVPDSLKPGTILDLSEDCEDARQAMQQVIVQDVSGALDKLLGIIEKYSDQESQLPRIAQGQAFEKYGPETAYEVSRIMEQAGKYMGAVIKNQDERLLEPIIEAFYQYIMMDPSVPEGKGDYLVQALGFSSFQDRFVRLTKIQQLLSIVLQNETLVVETRLRELLEEIAKALDLDPRQLLKSREEREAEIQAAQQDPMASIQMEGAQAKTDRERAETDARRSEVELNKERLVIERARAVSELESNRDQAALKVMQTAADVESKFAPPVTTGRTQAS